MRDKLCQLRLRRERAAGRAVCLPGHVLVDQRFAQPFADCVFAAFSRARLLRCCFRCALQLPMPRRPLGPMSRDLRASTVGPEFSWNALRRGLGAVPASHGLRGLCPGPVAATSLQCLHHTRVCLAGRFPFLGGLLRRLGQLECQLVGLRNDSVAGAHGPSDCEPSVFRFGPLPGSRHILPGPCLFVPPLWHGAELRNRGRGGPCHALHCAERAPPGRCDALRAARA
mmetsp:Transcript_2739/g.6459  ORF Transcript_2739/g.6459 Transcript_2739/m.6459 type:complete len:227 (-) Transcript_2739:678-1358(-)